MAGPAKRKAIANQMNKNAREYLNLALADVRKEEQKLRQRMKELKTRISSTDMKMTRTHSREDKIRDELSRLIALESRISSIKTRLKSELGAINERLIKIKKIDDEIKEASLG